MTCALPVMADATSTCRSCHSASRQGNWRRFNSLVSREGASHEAKRLTVEEAWQEYVRAALSLHLSRCGLRGYLREPRGFTTITSSLSDLALPERVG